VEGVFDAALLQVKGDSRAVASVAAQLNENQVETLRRHHIRSVYICGDPDGGGDRGTLANVAALEKAGIKAYVVPRLPDGMDPDEYVQAHGIDAWKALVSRSEHAYAFRAREIMDRHKAGGEAIWTDRAFEEALAYDERTTDPRARVDLDKYFWPVTRASLDLPEDTVRLCLEESRRQADRRREQKALEEQARAHESLLDEYRENLVEAGPEIALHRLHDEIDRLRRGGLRPQGGKRSSMWRKNSAPMRNAWRSGGTGNTSGSPRRPSKLWTRQPWDSVASCSWPPRPTWGKPPWPCNWERT
jgi:DNA primase